MASSKKSSASEPTPETPSSRSRPEERLATYRAKRRFGVTPEPAPEDLDGDFGDKARVHAKAGEVESADPPRSLQTAAEAGKKTAPLDPGAPLAGAQALAFVVQKHDARRLHYDVRLEIDGAMASWAVPKGPSFDPAVRRLAVETEDHPMAYNAFEGRIPDGEYGGGDVLIWDRGSYETVPRGQEQPMRAKGHLHVRLFGAKLVGDWHLVRTGRAGGDDGAGGSGKAQWLMFKAKDREANPGYDVVAERPESVVSGQISTRGPRRVGASGQGKSPSALLEAVGEPALATAVASLPHGDAWLFEVKYDGYRVLACKAGADVRVYTRRAHDWTARFRPIAEGVARLSARECVIDGEACVVDDAGRPSFAALQEWLSGGTTPAKIAYAVFDLLWLDGRDLRKEPIEVRREQLEKLVSAQGAPFSLSRAVEGPLRDLLVAAKAGGLEGLMAKRKGSPYVAGRSGHWLKMRFDRRQDCAIAGWIPLAGADEDVGALLLAIAEGGKLVFAGRVGTGFDDRTRHELAKKLGAGEAKTTVEGAPRIRDAHWVVPALVAECVFTEWTRDGSMRHPRFLRLRDDKAPLDCTREGPAVEAPAGEAPAAEVPAVEAPAVEVPAVEGPGVRPPLPHAAAAKGKASARGEGPKLANPTKVLFPRDGITKQDIWNYYTAVAEVMLPHLSGRPLTLQRYPDGIDGEEWYQQNAPDKTPGFVRQVEVGVHHGNKKQIVCESVETLQWLANLAALTLHQWVSHSPAELTTRAAIDGALGAPDYVVLDLDPGDGPWSHLVQVARAVHQLLDALALESYPKTSGKRGVHVVVPIAPGATHAEATGFAEQVARAVAKVLPDVATVERMKDKRGGRLYVDYGQNGEGRTIVSPYTIRARDGAVVSTPIAWDELDEELDPTRFTIRTVLARIEKRGDLFAGVLRGTKKLPSV
jgi:bifunctional non-homologous end joining protein LigD